MNLQVHYAAIFGYWVWTIRDENHRVVAAGRSPYEWTARFTGKRRLKKEVRDGHQG